MLSVVAENALSKRSVVGLLRGCLLFSWERFLFWAHAKLKSSCTFSRSRDWGRSEASPDLAASEAVCWGCVPENTAHCLCPDIHRSSTLSNACRPHSPLLQRSGSHLRPRPPLLAMCYDGGHPQGLRPSAVLFQPLLSCSMLCLKIATFTLKIYLLDL